MSSFGSMSGRSTNKFNKIISFLTQKLIDSETSQKEIFDSGEDDLPENIDIFDIEMERDLGTRSTLKTNENIYRMVEGATWTKQLRLWVKFSNAGNIYDYAKNGNITKVFGWSQIPILMNKKVLENVLGYEPQSFFNGQDQFAYTIDNPQIQIAPMFVNGAISKISFMDSFNPVSVTKQVGKETSVLFTKVDDDQIRDGYGATMNEKGDLFFYIKRNFKQYSLFMKGVYAAQLADELANGGDFNAADFNPLNFDTNKEYTTNLICSITKTHDHWWVYDKDTHNIKYMLNGITQFDSTMSWVTDPILDVPLQDGAYNTDGSTRTVINDIASGNNNGTLANPSNSRWQGNNTLFSFGSNSTGTGGGCEIAFPSITAINDATELTFSLSFEPDNRLNTKSYHEVLVSKNFGNNSSFVLWRPNGTRDLKFTYKDSSGVDNNLTFVEALYTSFRWYNIIVKLKNGEAPELTVNGTTVTGTTPITNISTSTTGFKIFDNNKSTRGQICLFKVWTSKLDTTDTQRITDEGYHNPLFPTAEKPQPVPDPDPEEVLIPFESFYNLALAGTTDANTIYLNSVAGSAPFFSTYSVADGTDSSNPEVLRYHVYDGVSTGGGVIGFTEVYTCTDSGNSSSELSENQGNAASAIAIMGTSSLTNTKPTKAIFYLRGDNSPTGTVRCKIWNSAGTPIHELHYNNNSASPLNAASVNTSDHTAYTFQNTNISGWSGSGMAFGWKIGIEYDNGGSGEDAIMVKRNRSNPKSGEWNTHRDYNGEWDDDNDPDADDLVANIFTGGTGTAVVNPWIEMGSDDVTTVAEYFGGSTTHNLLNQKPTKLILRLKKTGTPSGTFTVNMMTTAGAPLTGGTFSGPNTANSLTTSFADYTFTNLANPNTITHGIQIAISYGGSGGKVCVMTNLGNTTAAQPINTGGTMNYHGSTSYARKYEGGFTNLTGQDVSMRVYTGGNSFSASQAFGTNLTRIYEKPATTSSSIYNKRLTKAIFKLRRVGSPTGLISVVCRRFDNDNPRFTIGTFPAEDLTTSYTAITFQNVFNTIPTQLNDKISIEHTGSDGTAYVQVLRNTDVYETTHTIGGTYSSPVYTDNAQVDISGSMFFGGEPDLNSRTRVAQKIITNDSIIDGEKLTKILVYLKNPSGVLGNIHCIIYRGSDDQPIFTIESIPASSIGTNWTATEFENTNNGYVLDVDDKVAIVFEGGDSTHRIGVNLRAVSAGTYDGANSHVVAYNGNVYNDLNEWDLVATMWRGGFLFQPEPNAIPDPTPTNNKDLLFCAGNNLLSGFARLLMREFRLYTKEITEEQALNIYENRYSETSRSPSEVLVAGIYKPF